MFFTRRANELQDFIIRNKLEKNFKITETQLHDDEGFNYTFYRLTYNNQTIINSFRVYTKTRELDSLALFEYCLGFMDSFIIFNAKKLTKL